ncbi:glutamate synthase [NADPH] large chain [Vibrio maritimus]|uniref:Glutamate synthase [NADPH] large chain n=1 Tax=Vibrio maritimus TaxID=990268 RepID=A0A090U0A3_9VIBR|nr:glutamate synthase [NADPH] large chain [Vibrio maritimus]
MTAKQSKLDLSNILEAPVSPLSHPLYWTEPNQPFDKAELNQKIVEETETAVESRSGGSFYFDVRNTDRSVGARLSGSVAKRYGNQGMATSPIKLYLDGTAGQSLGVWNAGGVEIYLTGDANDYVGKGMAGGKLVIKPHVGTTFTCNDATIVGNTCLYGATGGKLYAAGTAGERFGVRNSGTIAVIEAPVTTLVNT